MDRGFHVLIAFQALIAAAWIAKGFSGGADPTFPLWKNDFVQGGVVLALAAWQWASLRRSRRAAAAPPSRAPGPRL